MTETLRLWAEGGPFPSQQSSFEAGTPVVLNLRPPDFSEGNYSVTYAATSPAPQLLIEIRNDCR